MQMKIFGKLTDIITEGLEPNFPLSIKELREALELKYPALEGLEFKIAINHQIIDSEEFTIKENDEITLLPPFSGG